MCRINAISNARVMGDDYNEGIFGKKAARVWLFFGFLLAFAGLIGSLWVFIQMFLVPGTYVRTYVHMWVSDIDGTCYKCVMYVPSA